jgi:hypothetical protein
MIGQGRYLTRDSSDRLRPEQVSSALSFLTRPKLRGLGAHQVGWRVATGVVTGILTNCLRSGRASPIVWLQLVTRERSTSWAPGGNCS